MNIELSQDDLVLLETLLAKEEGETRVEIHHSRNMEYEQYLKQRKELLHDLLQRFQSANPAPRHDREEASI